MQTEKKDGDDLKEAYNTVSSHRASSAFTAYVGIDATLDVVDTMSGPAIRLISHGYEFIDDERTMKTAEEDKKMPVMTKTVLLADIGSVTPATEHVWSAFGLNGKFTDGVFANSLATGRSNADTKHFIFEILQSNQHNLTRDEAVRHFNTVIGWNSVRLTPKVTGNDTLNGEMNYVLGDNSLEQTESDTHYKNEGIDIRGKSVHNPPPEEKKHYPTYTLMNEKYDEKKLVDEDVKEYKNVIAKAKDIKRAEVRKMEKRQGVVIIH